MTHGRDVPGQNIIQPTICPFLPRADLIFFVETPESVPDDILWVGALKTFAEERQEHRKVDRPRSIAHHVLLKL